MKITNNKKYLVVISGPTAVGKTALTVKLAKLLCCDIISADSRQIYKEMDVGTAKPSLDEREGITHHFIDNMSIHDSYSVGKYEKEVTELLDSYYQTHDVAILTGGTGLYIKAVLEGLADFPDVDPSFVKKYEAILESQGIDQLQFLLEQKDRPYFDEVDINNPRRLIRALSLIDATGQRFSDLRHGAVKERAFIPILINLTRDREILYQRINERVDQMLANGLLAEAKSLYPHRHLKSLDTVGYAEFFLSFDGIIDTWGAIELIKRNTRRYAKRQLTWMRNQQSEWHTVELYDNDASDDIMDYIKCQME